MSQFDKDWQEVDKLSATCPACTAAIRFNPETSKLSCPYCGFEEEIAKPENEQDQLAEEIDFESAIKHGNFNWGEEKKVVICNACAGESVYDVLEIANVCPYCGSNHLMESSADNALAPNGICPFQVTREQADINFKKWMKSRWFAPNEARKKAKADAFTGVYLPYWTFDSKTASQYTAEYGINRIVKDSEGNTKTVTDWYRTTGFHQEFIDDCLVRATTRYQENLLRKVEPFNTGQSLAYNNEYLTGYIAERYSIGLEDGWKIAQQDIHDQLEQSIRAAVRNRHHANKVRNVQFSTTHSNITYKYVMLPLWVSSFRYKDKVYQFLVNGQTGKVGGQSPLSPIKVTIAVIFALIILTIVGFYYMEGA